MLVYLLGSLLSLVVQKVVFYLRKVKNVLSSIVEMDLLIIDKTVYKL